MKDSVKIYKMRNKKVDMETTGNVRIGQRNQRKDIKCMTEIKEKYQKMKTGMG